MSSFKPNQDGDWEDWKEDTFKGNREAESQDRSEAMEEYRVCIELV